MIGLSNKDDEDNTYLGCYESTKEMVEKLLKKNNLEFSMAIY